MHRSPRGPLGTLLLLAIVFAGCSGDDSSSPQNTPSGAVDLSSLTVGVPPAMAAAASSNQGAAQAQTYLQLLNSFSIYMRYLQPPKATPTKLMANGVHTWTDGELTITLTVQDVGAEIVWTVTVDGSDGGQTYSDFLLLDGYREKGVNSGNFNLYSPTLTGSPVAYWTWSTDPDGVFTSAHHDLAWSVDVYATVQVSGGGSVAYYANNIVGFSSDWNPDGSGTYTIYDGSGTQVDSGSWSA
jgi:hypothetical protein